MNSKHVCFLQKPKTNSPNTCPRMLSPPNRGKPHGNERARPDNTRQTDITGGKLVRRYTYIPEKRKFSGIESIMFSSATQPPRHNFIVSTITFEGFKLRYSNLTHALLIQIYRTSSIIDIVVPSKKAAGGHFAKNFKTKRKVP